MTTSNMVMNHALQVIINGGCPSGVSAVHATQPAAGAVPLPEPDRLRRSGGRPGITGGDRKGKHAGDRYGIP